MLEPTPPDQGMVDALEVGSRLSELEMERGLAQGTALGNVRSYMADLEEELEDTRERYAVAVVTEIAMLRAELFGAQVG